MSTRRVRLGLFPGGEFSVRCTLPGYDVITDDASDQNKFSFNSDWNDVVKVTQIGSVTVSPVGIEVFIPNQGYIPMADARRIVGNVIYDDYISTFRTGVGIQVYANKLKFNSVDVSGMSFIYRVYKLAAPIQ